MQKSNATAITQEVGFEPEVRERRWSSDQEEGDREKPWRTTLNGYECQLDPRDDAEYGADDAEQDDGTPFRIPAFFDGSGNNQRHQPGNKKKDKEGLRQAEDEAKRGIGINLF